MITRLYLDNCFRHFDQTFHFEQGLTGVIGPNESGKSLIVEMIRYSLFGSAALRGKADDYKKLHVELDFTVGGENYTVLRKGTKCELSGARQVTGTKPVNEAIRSILGYDLTVFDVANACNQGNVEALSDMTPAARKTMVDKTVGLDQLDELIRYCGSEGNTLKREAAAISSTLVVPAEPEMPEGYRPSVEVAPEAEAASAALTEFNQLEGFLARTPREPVDPGDAPVSETAEQLKAHQDGRAAIERSIANLKSMISEFEPEAHTPQELDEFEAWMDQSDAWKRKQQLLAQGEICCPECGHTWPVADLGELSDVQEAHPPSMNRGQLAAHRARIGNNERIAKLEAQLASLSVPDDRSDDWAKRQAWEAEVEIFGRQKEAFDRYNAELPEKKSRHDELKGSADLVAALQAEMQAAQQYERDLDRYGRAKALYDENLALVEGITQRSDDFLKAREIIQALKVSVKTHLLPSLNKVASVLLGQMTGGERYQVEVDDDFEIVIDGQSISTLSGSGKAVANLAIRIALGQILTNRVFSVFMADEVDAAMDDERAGHTAEALRRLTEMVGQVVLVTHKRPETDHTFELKKT